MIVLWFCFLLIFIKAKAIPIWDPPSPVYNWTTDYDRDLAEFSLDFAAAAYSTTPEDCLKKHNATLIKRVQISCDYVHDEVSFGN